jgi:hypothetical protein
MDLIVRAADGKLVGTSGQSRAGAATFEAALDAGAYRVEAVTTKSQSLLSLSLASPASLAEYDAAVAALNNRDRLQRHLIAEELATLGFDPGLDSPISVGAQMVRAIKAFQASRCRPITGMLEEADEHRLAAAAAQREVARALDARRALNAAEKAGALTKYKATIRGEPVIAEIAGAGRRRIGRVTGNGWIYEGRLLETDTAIRLDGPGWQSAPLEAIGKFANDQLASRGRVVRPKGEILLGRLVRYVDQSRKSVDFGIFAGVAISPERSLAEQPKLGAAYQDCEKPSQGESSQLICSRGESEEPPEVDLGDDGDPARDRGRDN